LLINKKLLLRVGLFLLPDDFSSLEKAYLADFWRDPLRGNLS